MATVSKVYGETILLEQATETTSDIYACTSDNGVHFRLGSLGIGQSRLFLDVIRPEADLDNLASKDYSRSELPFEALSGTYSVYAEMVRGQRYRVYRNGGDNTLVTLWAESY